MLHDGHAADFRRESSVSTGHEHPPKAYGIFGKGSKQRLISAPPDLDSVFVRVQLEHAEVAGLLWLGEPKEDKIDLRKFKPRWR